MSGITRVAESELVVPRGFVIDEIAIDRLHAQLTRQPPEVTAVVAPIGDAPPGSSFRTVAQRAALQPPSRAFVTDEPHDGVALVRAGVEFELVGPRVRVAQGQILLDPGAASHDAEAPIGAFERAAAEGRSPFPRAPLVLFVGLEPESGRAIWARDLVNRLLDHGIEARLATVSEPDPPHLTRPCRPEAETVHALGPDVIVTLDDSALAIAPSWCDRRSTVVVHHTGERTLATELVSWRLGVASGRVRAFIGSAVDAPTLAALCSRLCSGPFPAPPQPERDDEGDRVTRVRAPGPSLRVAVVHGSSGATPRLASFLSEAKAQGAITETFGPSDASTASDHHVVILAHDLDAAAGLELVKQREQRGLKTVVDVVVPTPSTTLAERCGTRDGIGTRFAVDARGAGYHRSRPAEPVDAIRLDELQRAATGDRSRRVRDLGVGDRRRPEQTGIGGDVRRQLAPRRRPDARRRAAESGRTLVRWSSITPSRHDDRRRRHHRGGAVARPGVGGLRPVGHRLGPTSAAGRGGVPRNPNSLRR